MSIEKRYRIARVIKVTAENIYAKLKNDEEIIISLWNWMYDLRIEKANITFNMHGPFKMTESEIRERKISRPKVGAKIICFESAYLPENKTIYYHWGSWFHYRWLKLLLYVWRKC